MSTSAVDKQILSNKYKNTGVCNGMTADYTPAGSLSCYRKPIYKTLHCTQPVHRHM